YIDARLTTMSGDGLAVIGGLGLDRLAVRGWTPRAVGGLTLGADPVAYALALTARRRGQLLDAFTVRKQPKDHGTGKRIEGCLLPGFPVVIVEDVLTTGRSARHAITDLETFERSHRRRWAIAAGLFVLGILGRLSGTIETRLGTIVLVAGAAAVINALVGMINERGWYRWWFIYMLALLDVVLVNVLVL